MAYLQNSEDGHTAGERSRVFSLMVIGTFLNRVRSQNFDFSGDGLILLFNAVSVYMCCCLYHCISIPYLRCFSASDVSCFWVSSVIHTIAMLLRPTVFGPVTGIPVLAIYIHLSSLPVAKKASFNPLFFPNA